LGNLQTVSAIPHTSSPDPPRQTLASLGTIVAEFGENTQDSGNISYVLETPAGERCFVKTAGRVDDDGRWYLTHAQRVALLRNAVEIAGVLAGHRVAPKLHRVIESPYGPMLIYEFRAGELLHGSREERAKPSSPYQRFRALPAAQITAALHEVFDAHARLGEAGYVAVDFYDGSLIYDFAAGRITLCDCDNCHRGSFTNTMGRMFGSTRYMAPEEFERGATIDQRTTVFTMGRLIATFLGDGTLAREGFRGHDAQWGVMTQACHESPVERFNDLASFFAAWRAANAC
jgi:serine/threonine-protein kinase